MHTHRNELVEFIRFAGHHKPGEGWVMPFACYLDDSDDKQSSVVTLAGYLAKLDDWEAYEEHSREVYERFEIGDVLHTHQFHHRHGPFKGWGLAKKLTFTDALYERRRFVWGFGVSVGKAWFQANKSHPAVGPNLSPLGMAFRVILQSVVRGNPFGGVVQAEKVSFIVESGHRNNPDIERCFHFAEHQPLYQGALGTIAFHGKEKARALHLADFLAVHTRMHHARQCAHPRLIIPKSKIFDRITSKFPHSLQAMCHGTLQKVEDETLGDVPWAPVPLSSRPGGEG